MSHRAGYLVDLTSFKFDDGSNQSWIQAMPLGTYNHPVYGKIDITPERVQRFADNVNNNVRQTELDIDYDHKEYGGEAAGWVKQAAAKPDGLWLLVEWTQKAYQSLKDKAYRYFSPEFDDSWVNPKTGQQYQDVLFGGGITNRPFLKDILPINLSEAFEKAGDVQLGDSMNPDQLKQVAQLLGLPDDATGDQILGALQVKLRIPGNQDPNDPASPDTNNGGGAPNNPPKPKAPPPPMSEGDNVSHIEASEDALAGIKKLAESSPEAKKLFDLLDSQSKQLASQAKQLKEAAVKDTVTKLNEKAKEKGYALSPVVEESLTSAFMQIESTKLNDSIVQAFDTLLDKGLVRMGEYGQERTGSEGDKTATMKFSEKVVEIRKTDDKLSYSDAVVRAAQQNPQLFEEYQQESYAG